MLKILILDNDITYDGSQLRPLWAFEEFGIKGSSIICWKGGMDVKYILDAEDEKLGKRIAGEKLLHFRIEMFDVQNDVRLAYTRQRLFTCVAKEVLEELSGKKIIRKGDDLFYQNKKLSVSIATSSQNSLLIHFALNLSPNAPVPVATLPEIGIDEDDWKKVVELIANKFKNELKDIEDDISKTRCF